MQDAYPCVGLLCGHEGHTPKSCCPPLFTLLISQKSEKSYASSRHNNNKALHITFNSCKTVSTSSMALATVNIHKIIKVTSASSQSRYEYVAGPRCKAHYFVKTSTKKIIQKALYDWCANTRLCTVACTLCICIIQHTGWSKKLSPTE